MHHLGDEHRCAGAETAVRLLVVLVVVLVLLVAAVEVTTLKDRELWFVLLVGDKVVGCWWLTGEGLCDF